MAGDPEYAYEKLFLTMHQLATSEEDLKTRLYNVLIGDPVALSEDDFPTEDLQKTYRQFRQMVSRVEASGDEGTYLATIQQMDIAEVKRHLGTIVNLYDGLLRARSSAEL